MNKGKMTAKDEELIEMAYSTTYSSSIRQYIKEAEKKEARAILTSILNDNSVHWED